jgi:RHS repeat-associated protein
MHGCPIDVLADGLVLQYNRARYYDVKNGRWLQRDPAGYRDSGNLYEAFRTNPSRWSDPSGEVPGDDLLFVEEARREALREAGVSEAEVDRLFRIEHEAALSVPVGMAKGVYRVVSGTLSGLWQLVSSPRQTLSAIGGAWSAEYHSFRASGAGVADAVGATAADQVLILVGADGVVSILEGTDRFGNRLDLESSVATLTESGIQAALVVVPASKAITASSRPLVLLPERTAAEAAAAGTSEGRAVLGSTLSPGSTIGKQLVFPFAEPAPVVWAEPKSGTLVISPYGELSLSTSSPGQAHHLNQAAAYSDVIPIRQGMAIKLEGNIFTDVGAPHTMAHIYLEESFWSLYRRTGAIPTNLQYTRALQQSLRAAGLSEAQVQQTVRAAIRERVNFGLLGGGKVPKVPYEIRHLAR